MVAEFLVSYLVHSCALVGTLLMNIVGKVDVDMAILNRDV